jgi:hypothetical protein
VVEQADTADSKPAASRHEGSIPSRRTNLYSQPRKEQSMDTLLLDSRCLPVDCKPWPWTVLQLATNESKKHIRIHSVYENRHIKYGRGVIQLPAVLQLVPGELSNGRWAERVVRRKNSVKFNRMGIYSRDGGRCQYCNSPVSRWNFSFDHVIPRSQGGVTSWENIVTCCFECNQRKGGCTPEQAGMRLLSTPHRPEKTTQYFFGFFEEGMPEQWRPWLPDASGRDGRATRLYWSGRLRNGK